LFALQVKPRFQKQPIPGWIGAFWSFLSMLARQPGPYDSVARKWLALAERRRLHLDELRDTGRWRHYYTSAELLEAIREAVVLRDKWARILVPRDEGDADD
jgi:hypothetical protein